MMPPPGVLRGLLRRMSWFLWVAGLVLGCAHARALPWLGETLSPGRHYIWEIRADHSDPLWFPANDSLDIVLLRDLCERRPGDWAGGCWSREDSSVTVRWDTPGHRGLAVRPLARGEWIFGPGSAGARLYGLTPGPAVVRARLPQGTLVDTVLVLPAFDRLRIEPRDSFITVGDTIWFRVMGLRDDGSHVHLPWPLHGRQVGAPRADGAIPIVFEHVDHPSTPGRYITVVFGSKRDSVWHRYIERRSSPSSAPTPGDRWE